MYTGGWDDETVNYTSLGGALLDIYCTLREIAHIGNNLFSLPIDLGTEFLRYQ